MAPRNAPGLAALPRVDEDLLDYIDRLIDESSTELRAFAADAIATLRHAVIRGSPVLLHNDFNWRNLVVRRCARKLAGVIDWTVAGFGDRRLDLRALGSLSAPALATFTAVCEAAGDAPLDRRCIGAAARLGLLSNYLRAEPALRDGAALLIQGYRSIA